MSGAFAPGWCCRQTETRTGRVRHGPRYVADAHFITAAPPDIAALLAEVEQLRAEVARLHATAAEIGDDAAGVG